MVKNYVVTELMTHAQNFQEIYYQHDGATPYYATVVHDYLNKSFSRRVISQWAGIAMPSHLPTIM